MYQHHQLHRSRLVLLLQQWAAQAPAGGAYVAHPTHPAPARQDVAEQLSLWLSTVDAVQLSRALHALESPAVLDGPPPAPVDVRALQTTLDAAQAELAALAQARPLVPTPARERADNTPVEQPDPEAAAEFALYAARYLAVQKQVENRVAGLRAQLRQRLAAGPDSLRRLAALDAVMEHMLGTREQRLWASLPGYLERRMVQRRAAHQQQLQDEGRADEPHCWALPGGWLHAFEQDMRALQRAELQARLQPLSGLLEAARHHAAAGTSSVRRRVFASRPAPETTDNVKTKEMVAMTGTNE